jgi:superfamily II DNA or RNA helicase
MKYLNNRGYVVYKNDISEKMKSQIISDLTVKPNIPKAMMKVTPYPIYRESTSKYYLPRFYGLRMFGDDYDIKISNGLDFENIHFHGALRDYQNNIVDKYVKHVGDIGGGLLEIDTGLGKTVIGLNIISRLKKKTLIIVHKEFLLNQWVERIREFLPQARIGKIQGKIIDIEDKEIVIAMLQSISMKTYDNEVFESFGFTIIDEVHHLGAEVFCQAFLKFNTAYCLGLSATMNRKDGLSKVFKLFLGEIIHTEKREMTTTLNVKAIDYSLDDEEYNKMVYNFKGDPLYSTMISKVCNCTYRSEFILSVLENEFRLNPDQQMILLAHNKSLLQYLYDAISHRKINSVGYYVGGMKEQQLKESETKKIILATYSMASEGLDIKTLTTLVLASPKTDIVQAIGRILRTKHTNPLVIDIVDSHDIFQRQFLKRKQYYKKQNYEVLRSNQGDYKNDIWSKVDHKRSKQRCLIKSSVDLT